MRVKGRQTIANLRFFDGAASNVYGWSFYDFSRFFTPECDLLDQRYVLVDKTGGYEVFSAL